MEHIVEEDILRNFLRKEGILQEEDAVLRAGEEEGKIIVGQVAEGTVGADPLGRQEHVLAGVRRLQSRQNLPLAHLTGPLQQGREFLFCGFPHVG